MAFVSRNKAAKYTPQDDDTLASIAARESDAGNPITESELALYNFGSDDPDVVDEFLRDELGCHRRGGDKRFVISADAAVRTSLLIPKPYDAKGLALGRVHTLRVRGPVAPPKQFEGCATQPDDASVAALRRLGMQIQGAESARGQSLQRRQRRSAA